MRAADTKIRDARSGDAKRLARVETETWRDAYATLLPEAYLTRQVGRRSNWPLRLRGANRNVLVAETGDAGVVGYATWGRSQKGLPQIYELYVLADHRDQGHGRRLCAEVARRVMRDGAKELYVEVLDGNPARYFYEVLGARLNARTEHAFGGEMLPSLVYVWTDLKALAR